MLSLLLFLAATAAAAIVDCAIVDLSPGNQQGIAAAVRTARSGDTIQLQAGTYNGSENCNIIFSSDNIVLRGVNGSSQTIIDCGHQSRCLSLIEVSGIRIEGIQFRNGIAPNTVINAKNPLIVRSSALSSPKKKWLPVLRRNVHRRFLMFSVRYYLDFDGIVKLDQKFENKKKKKNDKFTTKTSSSSSSSSFIRSTTSIPALTLSLGGNIFVFSGRNITFRDVVVTGGQALRGCGIAVVNSSWISFQGHANNNGWSTIEDAIELQGAGALFYNSSDISIMANSSFSYNHFRNGGIISIVGAGLYLKQCQNVVAFGPLDVSYNTIVSDTVNRTQDNGVWGVGLYSLLCTNITLFGPLHFTYNEANSSALDLNGGGLNFQAVQGLTILGPAIVENNIIRILNLTVGSVGGMSGAGISVVNGQNLVFSGAISASKNSVISESSVHMGIGLFAGGIFFFGASGLTLIGGPLLIDNNFVSSVNNGANGGGIGFQSCQDVIVTGFLSASNNMLLSQSRSGLNGAWGAGIYIALCNNIQLTGPIIADNNIIESFFDELAGSGMSIQYTANLTLIGPISASNNSIRCHSTDNFYGIMGAGLSLSYATNVTIFGPLDINNNLLQSQGDNLNAAGFGLESNNNITIAYFININNNIIISSAQICTTGLWGGGLMIIGSSQYTVYGPLSISNNLIISQCGHVSGGGAFFQMVYSMTMVGPIYINNNSITISNSLRNENLGSWGGGVDVQSPTDWSINGPLYICGNRIDSNNDNVNGGGLMVSSAYVFVLVGPIFVNNNFVSSSANHSEDSGIKGAGSFFLDCTNIYIIGPAHFNNNTLEASAVTAQGAGMFWAVCLRVTMDGPIQINNNSAIVRNKLNSQRTLPYYKNATCASTTEFVMNTDGTISDGFYPSLYDAGLNCMWVVAPSNDLNRAFGVFEITFTRLDLFSSPACTVDSISLYDGPSSTFPLIGSYCGSIDSAQNNCQNGACPSLVYPINTTSAGFFILFHTDNRKVETFQLGTGFQLSWKLVTAPTSLDGKPGRMPTLAEQSDLCCGGGMALKSCSYIQITNGEFSNNRIRHPLMAVGAGLVLLGGSQLETALSSFSSNIASSFIAGGGAIASLDFSTMVTASCNFTENEAIAEFPSCLNSFDYVIRCPVSYGGSILGVRSLVSVEDSIFTGNAASCAKISPKCRASGGAIAGTRNSTLNFWDSACTSNYLGCDAPNCTEGSGGCLYGDSYSLSMLGSVIENNRAGGVNGVGGGIVGAETMNIVIQNSQILNNSAGQGGGIQVRQDASCSVSSSTFKHNTGILLGGAAYTSGSAVFVIQDSISIHDKSSVGSVGFVTGKVTSIQNISVIGAAGVFTVIVGSHNFTEINYRCTNPGSHFDLKSGGQDAFSLLECKICSQGTFLASYASSSDPVDKKCLSCPLGGMCMGSSSNDTGFGLRSLPNFWGIVNLEVGSATFIKCPNGYCCEDDSNCPYNYCYGNRDGVLCGSCKDGFSIQLFSTACAPDSECNAAKWVIPILFIVFVLIVLVIAKFSDFSSDGMLSTTIYFYQAAPLAMSMSAQNLFGPVVSGMESIFNLAPKGVMGGWAHLCLFPGMTTKLKLVYEISAYVLFLGAVAVVWAIHLLFWKKLHLLDKKPHAATYLAVATKIIIFSYITITVNTMNMLDCVTIEGEDRWFLDADVICYANWQKVAMAAAVVLSLVPFLVGGITLKWGHGHGLGSIQSKLRHMLISPYRRGTWWWAGISMGRRLLISITYTWTYNSSWRSGAMLILCSTFLGLQLWTRPFSNAWVQMHENISLLIMSVLVALSTSRLTYEQFGLYSGNVKLEDEKVQGMQLFLFLIPALSTAAYFGKRAIVRVKLYVGRKGDGSYELGMRLTEGGKINDNTNSDDNDGSSSSSSYRRFDEE